MEKLSLEMEKEIEQKRRTTMDKKHQDDALSRVDSESQSQLKLNRNESVPKNVLGSHYKKFEYHDEDNGLTFPAE